jgi:hypothetical protein
MFINDRLTILAALNDSIDKPFAGMDLCLDGYG